MARIVKYFLLLICLSIFFIPAKLYAADINLTLNKNGEVTNAETGESLGELHRGWRTNVLFVPILTNLDSGPTDTITITSSDGIIDSVNPKLYAIHGASSQQISSSPQSRSWFVNSMYGGQITIVAEVKSGIFSDPIIWRILSALSNIPDPAWVAMGLLLPLVLLTSLALRRRLRVRITDIDSNIHPEILNTSPGALTVLIRGFVSRRASAATLIDLAIRGHIRILIRDDNVVMYRDKGRDELRNHESFMMERWFKQSFNSTGYQLSKEIKTQMINQQSKTANLAIYQEVESYGWFKPSPLVTHWRLYIITFLLTAIFGTIFLSAYLFLPSATPLLWFLGGVMVTCAILYSSTPGIARMSPHGSDVLAKLISSKSVLTSKIPVPPSLVNQNAWEQYLPLAIVLGVTPQWLGRWKDAEFRQPSWLMTPDPIRDFDQFQQYIAPVLKVASESIRDTIMPAYL
ncbi:MAG: hypothetical protein WC773_00010 [Patescibacteria group bacterium]|jgi:hypothetical protein